MTTEEHVVAALKNAQKSDFPFPYFFAENVFPAPFYAKIQALLAQKTDFEAKSFANRTFAIDSMIPGLEFMGKREFLSGVLHLFLGPLQKRFGGSTTPFYPELRLIRDHKDYKIGPHTDAPWKVVSLLFYLPPDDSLLEYGTSLFVPIDPTTRCKGGPHYNFEPFREVWRAPFIPNSCLGFWKTDQSFHGVHPIPIEIQRDVLLYNIYCKEPSP